MPPPPVTHFLLIDSLLSGNWQILGSALAQSVLPVLTLGIVYSAYFGKTARTVLAAALDSSQIEFARACGLPRRQIIGYAVLMGRTPILTYAAILFGTLIGGEAIVETIFGWQGVGQWALEGVLKVDIPVIQGFVILGGFATLLIYLLLDVVVSVLDPRISYG
jgi:peptide/nickel transport system permease protein